MTNTEDRKEISIDQLNEGVRKGTINMANVKAEGIVTIRDKDGNIKRKLNVTEVIPNAT